jgi:flagellar biosynthesis/type III secretory pathway protein FliH
VPELSGVLAEHLDLVRWGRFLGAVTDDEREELAMQDPAIREAKDTLDLLSADPAVQDLVQRRKLALDLHQIDLRAAEAEGEAKGETKGRAEGKAEGLAEGEAKGRAEGLRIGVQRLCDVLGLELDNHKRQELVRMSDTELEALSDTLTRERRWPAQ